MARIFRKYHLPRHLEIVCLLVIATLLQMMDGSPFTMRERWQVVWDTDLPLNHFNPFVQKCIKTLLSVIVAIRCATTYAYAVSAMLVIFCLLKRTAPKLMCLWLLIGWVKPISMIFLECLIGVYVCSAFGRIRKPCVEFFIVKALELIFATYLWGNVLNIYKDIEKELEQKKARREETLLSKKHDFRRLRARSLIDESTLSKTTYFNNFERRDVPLLILQMLKRDEEMSDDSLLAPGMMLASVSNLGSFENIKKSQSLGELGFTDLTNTEVFGIEENENLTTEDKVLKFLKLTGSEVRNIRLNKSSLGKDIYNIGDDIWKRVVASRMNVKHPKLPRTEIFIRKISPMDLGDEEASGVDRTSQMPFRSIFSLLLSDKKGKDEEEDEDQDQDITSQDEEEDDDRIFMSNLKDGGTINRIKMGPTFKKMRGREYANLYKKDFMSEIGPEVFDKASRLRKLTSLTKIRAITSRPQRSTPDLSRRKSKKIKYIDHDFGKTTIWHENFNEEKLGSISQRGSWVYRHHSDSMDNIHSRENRNTISFDLHNSDSDIKTTKSRNQEVRKAESEDYVARDVKENDEEADPIKLESEAIPEIKLDDEEAAEPKFGEKSPEPKRAEEKFPESKSPEPKSPEPKSPEPKRGEDKSPEPKRGEDKSPEPKRGEDKSPEPKRGEDKSPEPRTPESKWVEDKSPEPRSPESKWVEDKFPESKSPEPKLLEKKSAEAKLGVEKPPEPKLGGKKSAEGKLKEKKPSEIEKSSSARRGEETQGTNLTGQELTSTEDPGLLALPESSNSDRSSTALKNRKIMIRWVGQRKPKYLFRNRSSSTRSPPDDSDTVTDLPPKAAPDSKKELAVFRSARSNGSGKQLSSKRGETLEVKTKKFKDSETKQVYYVSQLFRKPLFDVLTTYYDLKKRVYLKSHVRSRSEKLKFPKLLHGKNRLKETEKLLNRLAMESKQEKNWKSEVLKRSEARNQAVPATYGSISNTLKKRAAIRKLLMFEYHYLVQKYKRLHETKSDDFGLPSPDENSIETDSSDFSGDNSETESDTNSSLNITTESAVSLSLQGYPTDLPEESMSEVLDPAVSELQPSDNLYPEDEDIQIGITDTAKSAAGLDQEDRTPHVWADEEGELLCNQESDEPISLYYSKAANLASPLLDMKGFIYPDHIHYSYKHVKKKGFDVDINGGFPLLMRESLTVGGHRVKIEHKWEAKKQDCEITRRPMDLSFAKTNAFAEWHSNDQNDLDSTVSETIFAAECDDFAAEIKSEAELPETKEIKWKEDTVDHCNIRQSIKNEFQKAKAKFQEQNSNDLKYLYQARDSVLIEKLLKMHKKLNAEDSNGTKESQQSPALISSSQLHSNKGRLSPPYNPAVVLGENRTNNEKKKSETQKERTKDMFARLERDALLQNRVLQKSFGHPRKS